MTMTPLVACLFILGMTAPGIPQDVQERFSLEQDNERKAMLAAVLKAKPGTQPLQLSNAELKRKFDLAGRLEQYNLLRLNRSMVEKKYNHEGDFVGYYYSRFHQLFEEKARTTWLLAYATENKTEKAFFDKLAEKTGLKGEKRKTVTLSYYHLQYPAERVYYVELLVLVYKNNEADFNNLNKRAKDWVSERSAMFP